MKMNSNKLMNFLAIVSLSATLVACNEKISPSLQDSNSVLPPVAPVLSENTFGVANNNLVSTGFSLHKTGSGNWNQPCEIKSTTPFSVEAFNADRSTFDVSCYFEAEELAMFITGLKYKLSASPNACEFVAYSPYSFYDWMPGDSTSNLTYVTCEPGITPADLATIPGDLPDTSFPVRAGNKVVCNEIVDEVTPLINRRARLLGADEKVLCEYDYTSTQGAPNCDIGRVTINEIRVTKDAVSGDVTASPVAPRTVVCGGQVSNCVAGPIKQEPAAANFTSVMIYTEVPLDTTYAKEYELPGLVQTQRRTSVQYANYRRHLASTTIDFDNNTDFTDPAYLASFTGRTDFEPDLMSRYGSNLNMNLGSPARIITNTMLDNYALAKGWRTRPLAAEPFIGLNDSVNYYQVQPYYTFYCLDGNEDIKARIKMVVRDWDRAFPKNSSMEYISDIFDMGASPPFIPRQDLPIGLQIPGDPDASNGYNDKADWDDLLVVRRTPTGPFQTFPTTTSWEPVNGWFSSTLFTKGNY